MRLAKFLTAVAAVSMASSAIAAPAARLSVSQARVATLTSESNEAEGSTGIIIGVLAAAAVIGGIIIIADSDDSPSSP